MFDIKKVAYIIFRNMVVFRNTIFKTVNVCTVMMKPAFSLFQLWPFLD